MTDRRVEAALAAWFGGNRWREFSHTAIYEARAGMAAALAAADAVAGDGWCRNMSKAPRDEAIQVIGGQAEYPITASWSGMFDEPWQIDACQQTWGEIDPPTAWRPLPAAPKDVSDGR
jgi:hypothetical protein